MLSRDKDLDDAGHRTIRGTANRPGPAGVAAARGLSPLDEPVGTGDRRVGPDLTASSASRPATEPDLLELTAGRRVCLELADDGTVVARVDRVSDDVLDVRLLDELPDPGATPSVLGILVVDRMGLFRWPAVALAVDLPDRILLTITGPGTMLQRRRHERIDVDLTATVRRFRGLEPEASRTGRVVDLSRGGLRLVGPALEIGDVIDVRIDTPPAGLHATGRVVLAYPDGRGGSVAHVAFLVPSGADGLAEVDAYLRTLTGPPEPAVVGAGGPMVAGVAERAVRRVIVIP